jgi:hypothetical protein
MDDMQEMLEHYRITKLVNEYCHGCDRGDELRMAGVYAKDSWDDHGLRKMPGQQYAHEVMQGRAQIRDMISHQLGQTLVKVDGDRAGAETYFVATLRRDDVQPLMLDQLGGRYVDELVREDGTWKIKKRLTIRDWSITVPIEEDRIGQRQFIEGRADGEDPSFAVLGVVHSGKPKRPARPLPYRGGEKGSGSRER